MLQNYHENYLKIQRSLIFKWQWYGHQIFKLFDLNEDFSKLTEQIP